LSTNVYCLFIYEDDNAYLVFAMLSGIRVLSLGEKEKYYSVVERLGTPVSVSYNARGNYIYWTDAMENEEAIWRSRLDGSELEVIVNTGKVSLRST